METEKNAKPLIRIKNLKKTYQAKGKEPIEAIKSLSFDVAEGEFISVVGPSGCGKSTVLKILAGLLPKSDGEVTLREEPIHGPRRDIGVVFQNSVLLPWRNILQNVILPAQVQKLDLRDYRDKALDLLKMVGLERFENKYPYELSGGMQQRVSLARALIHDPSILLMDEPFGALDAMTREYMNLELLRIWNESKKTVFFITHSISEAVFLADRVVVLSERPSTVAEIVTVDLRRPRDLDLMVSDRFGRYVKSIRHRFDARGWLD